MQSDEQLRRETGQEPDNIDGRPVTCRLDELRSHPSYLRNGLTVSASQLSALVDLGDLAFREPIVITRDRFIVDGYGRLALARQQGRLTIRCVECDLTEQEALQYLLQKHRRSDGWNAFTRISLALDLEPGLKEKARSNQRAGGQNKGLSNLTKPERVHVRSEIAAAAGVRPTNVGKVDHLFRTAIPDLLQALRKGEVSIHRAWLWSKEPPQNQLEKFRRHRIEKGIKQKVRTLVSRQRSKIIQPVADPPSLTLVDLGKLVRHLSALEASKFGPVIMALIEALGKVIFLTEELFRALEAHEELLPPC